jgi:hypothetical protein
MTKLISFAVAAAFIVSGTAPVLAQSAHFEAMGFPATLHQAQITGLADLQEHAPTPALVAGAMPVSPHQLAVLSPRRQGEPMQVVQRRDAGMSVKR